MFRLFLCSLLTYSLGHEDMAHMRPHALDGFLTDVHQEVNMIAGSWTGKYHHPAEVLFKKVERAMEQRL